MAKFKPIYTTTEKLSTIELVDGQIIIVQNEPAIYVDMQQQRTKVGNVGGGGGSTQATTYKPGVGIDFVTNEDETVTINNTGMTAEIIDNYWYVNGENTGVKAVGEDGATPTVEIDPNTKMWIINGTSTSVIAEADTISQSDYKAMIDLLDSINTKIEQALNRGV